MILFVVPGLLALSRWCLMGPLIVLERTGIREARRRSSKLVKGRTGGVLLVMVAVSALEYGVPEWAAVRAGRDWVYYAVSAAVTPFVAHVLSSLYYRLADPERPVIAPRHQNLESPWDERALDDLR